MLSKMKNLVNFCLIFPIVEKCKGYFINGPCFLNNVYAEYRHRIPPKLKKCPHPKYENKCFCNKFTDVGLLNVDIYFPRLNGLFTFWLTPYFFREIYLNNLSMHRHVLLPEQFNV